MKEIPMRAAIYHQFGGADVLQVREVDDPPVGPDTVLVRARATSVNPVDYKIREGYLRSAFPHHPPIIPGWDVAGVVEQVGPAVRTGISVGDEVFGYVRRDDVCFGTTAELVPAPERTVTRKPGGISFEEAAALPLAGSTAYQALVEALDVQRGDRVLVHAASGGVGHFAVQIAQALGAGVGGAAGTAHHHPLPLQRGPRGGYHPPRGRSEQSPGRAGGCGAGPRRWLGSGGRTPTGPRG